MIFYSHCKINIGLNVTAKRSDGYHNIESLFYPVKAISDAIEIVPCQQQSPIEFSSSGIEVDCGSDKNLCVRAYMLMRERYGIGAVKMHLHKNIPLGAGLGGGSANCAAVIKGLNEIFALGLDSEAMCSLGAELGSDVPFFIEEQPAWVSGRGELLQRADVSLEGLYLIIIKPEVHISTPWAYSQIIPEDKGCLRTKIEQGIDSWRASVENDFENAVFKEHAIIKDIKQSLYSSGALFALMSGSGASVYGIFKQKPKVDFKLDTQCFVFECVI